MTTLIKQKHIDDLMLSDDFCKLATKINKFNVFNVLKLQNAEIRHSNFLGWLLDPGETHRILDGFLKELLKIILKDHSDNPNVSMCISDILFNDFGDTIVTLEKMTDKGRRIDILLESKSNQFVCVIENKVWSGEGCNQLEDYYDYINSHKRYSQYRHKLFVFLTPSTEYNCTQLYKNYIRLDYEKICKAIDRVLQNNALIDCNVRAFIENYKEMVERNIMGKYDKDVLELCTMIYKEYGSIIDLIAQQGNPKTCVLSVLNEVLEERSDLVDIHSKNDGFLFLPNDLNDKEKLNIDNSNNSVVNLNCWGYAWGMNGLFLEILVDSGKHKFGINSNERNSLLRHIENEMNKKVENKISFIREDKELSPSRELYEILSHDEYLSCENRDEIKQKIKNNLEKSGYIEALREALNTWNPKK